MIDITLNDIIENSELTDVQFCDLIDLSNDYKTQLLMQEFAGEL